VRSLLLGFGFAAVLHPASLDQSVITTLLGAAPDGIAALSATLNTPSAAAADSKGNVYVALKGTRQVVRIGGDGIVWTVAGNGAQGVSGDGGPAKAATFNQIAALAVDGDGNLFICDSAAHRIRRVGTDGMVTAFAGTGRSGNSGDGGPALQAAFNSPSGIVFDNSGNLLVADTGNHVIRKISPDGTVTRIAGDGKRGSDGNDGAAIEARLDTPQGLAVDSAGNIFIADTGNNWIRQIAPDGTLTRYAGRDTSSSSGFPGGQGDPNIATNATLSTPTGLAIDQVGNVYVLEYGAIRVRRITLDGKIANYAGTGTGGSAGDGGVARSAPINALGIAMDRTDNLILADGVSNKVRVVTAADGIINSIAGNGLASYNPRGLALKGNVLYFTDGNRVRTFDLNTRVLGIAAGDGQSIYSGDGGDALTASLNGPRGIAFDSSGRLYIADTGNQRVRRVGTDGKIATVAGNGTVTSSSNPTSDLTTATSTTINEPVGVAVDSSGKFYFAERSGNRIRVVGTDGIINTLAGTGTAGSPDAETGAATSQKVSFPQGLTAESGGSVLIADTGNNRIRRIFPDGTITTVVGNGASSFTGDGGPAAAGSLRSPNAVAVDSNGNLFIADTSNHVIRRVSPDGILGTSAGIVRASGTNSTGGYNGDGSPATAYSLNGPTFVLPVSNCSLLIADTSNQRIRQLSASIEYVISTQPAGLQVTVDGQALTTLASAGLLPGTTHHIDAPTPQSGPSGTRYVKTSSAIDVNVTCGAGRVPLSMSFETQYSLSASTSDGGTISNAAAWQTAGAKVTITASPSAGYVFAGWSGACTGTGDCSFTMDSPKSVRADFAPAQTLQPAITSGSVVGAGLSVPAVTAISPNGIASVFGSGFAPGGTVKSAGTADLVDGKLPTKLGGVCVLVGGVAAPLFAVTPGQVNFQAPQLTGSSATVQVVTACGASNEARSAAINVAVQPSSPEFFYFVQNANGKNPIAAVNASTGSLVGQPGLISGATVAPAKTGEVVTLYATGLGATIPPFTAGQLPDQAASVSGVQVTIGSVTLGSADLLYAGVTPGFAGLYQLNIRIPGGIPDGDQSVVLSVNGVRSPSGAYVTIKQ
jgi:uncharacterized protein (TIGR03437 family)